MSAAAILDWHEANQRYLIASLSEVQDLLEQHIASQQSTTRAQEVGGAGAAGPEPPEIAEVMPAPPALEMVCELFGLSPFERKLLLLCAAMELDSSFAALCAAAQDDARHVYPTFGLGLAALPEVHWSALSPSGPLRYWRLIEVERGDTLTSSPLRIDERILHYLAGVEHLDERLVGYVEPLLLADERANEAYITSLVPSHQTVAQHLSAAWLQATEDGSLSAVQLCGDEEAGRRAIAVAACEILGLDLYLMPTLGIPLDSRELEALIRLWQREAVLSGSALLLEFGEKDPNDAARESTIARLIEDIGSALIVSGRERRSAAHRSLITLQVERPTSAEQRTLWQGTLGAAATILDGQVENLVSQFNLAEPAIRAACAVALATSDRSTHNNQQKTNNNEQFPDDLGDTLWDICRIQARPHLESLAQRIQPVATWDDLILSAAHKEILREIGMHVRQRMQVYEIWGFASKGERGLGISALFTGASGTGKTMAGEVLANELRLDLYRIDLSQVVSKYIGETEKNLRRVFDAAEGGGAILLFDEADALFGKRSEVKDSHDRYANIEISYLLQRMEAYRGLAILTTNMKSALDSSFLRRIRFVVPFPFPKATDRAEIWRRIYPTATPTEGLDVERLARLNVAGGSIRNIALQAAFLAADAGQPVRMAHLLRATRTEYGKLEKSLTETEIRGWA